VAQDYVTEPAAAKIAIVADLRELIGRTEAAILTDYRGLSVAELTDLRKKLRAVDAEFRVVKNTLFKLAADGLMPVTDFDAHLTGPTAIGFAKSDAVGAAKVIVDYAKDHKAITLAAPTASLFAKPIAVGPVRCASKPELWPARCTTPSRSWLCPRPPRARY